MCHFIDLAIWFAKSLPVDVHALSTPDPSHRHESWAIQLRFASGGVGIVHYVCGSNAGWEREELDVLGGGRSARLAGFRELRLRGGAGGKRIVRMQPDAGQRAMLEAMMAQFRRASGAADYTESFVLSAQALLAAKRSIAERRVVTLGTKFPFALS